MRRSIPRRQWPFVASSKGSAGRTHGPSFTPHVTIARGARHGCRLRRSTATSRCVSVSNWAIGRHSGRRRHRQRRIRLRSDAEGTHHKIPQVGGLVVEDDVEIGANATIDRPALEKRALARARKSTTWSRSRMASPSDGKSCSPPRLESRGARRSRMRDAGGAGRCGGPHHDWQRHHRDGAVRRAEFGRCRVVHLGLSGDRQSRLAALLSRVPRDCRRCGKPSPISKRGSPRSRTRIKDSHVARRTRTWHVALDAPCTWHWHARG